MLKTPPRFLAIDDDQVVLSLAARLAEATQPLDPARLRHLLHQVQGEAERPHTAEPARGEQDDFLGMVGHSRSLRDVCALLTRLAPHARTALVTGETGTGKELAVRALHALGPRSQRRLLTVNCAAVVETLFESELFGHVRGAFTGATENKAGLFESADGSTLFLDEVGELPAGAQAKLLRVLEDGEVQRVGSVETRRVDVRVIAATNRDLHADVAAGRFRGDLYYRLNVVQVHLPPLSERREDIPSLARAFVAAFSRRTGKAVTGLTPEAERMLSDATWDGNVRQLRNTVERACILSDGDRVTEKDLAGCMELAELDKAPARPTRTLVGLPAPVAVRLDDVEREHIVRTLAQVRGNKAVAARLLGISRRAFYRQLERHGLHHRLPGIPLAVTTTVSPGLLERAS